MKRILSIGITCFFVSLLIPMKVFAGGGIFASGGGTVSVGQTFTITVTASGDAFDSLQGVISVSGPVSVISFSPGSATWLPGKAPAEGTQFVGITSSTTSLQVASIKLKASSTGTGNVTVSGAKLASNGSLVGESGGSAGFTVKEAAPKPEAIGAVNVKSSTHPDQNEAYEATTVELSWDAVAKATGYSYLIDQTEGTVPPETVTSADTAVKYENQSVGTHYFHIRAKTSNGFGPTTQFKVNIKEPEAKVDEKLVKPSNIKISKRADFKNDIETGTLQNFEISGKTEPEYDVLIMINPSITLPTGKELKAKADKNGNFSYIIDFPVKAGVYKLIVQGQKDKVLTPTSDPINFELVLSGGGDIKLITNKDASNLSRLKSFFLKYKYWILITFLLALAIAAILIIKKRGSGGRGKRQSLDHFNDLTINNQTNDSVNQDINYRQ